MIRNLFIASVLLAISFALNARADDPPQNEKIADAMARGIKLIETKDYEAFLKSFMIPEQLAKITERVPFSEMAKSFGIRKSESVLSMLKRAQMLRPSINDDGSLTYKWDEPIDGKSDVTFVKVDGIWRIKN